MSIIIGDKPEMNVVNIGDEISAAQLEAIQNATGATGSNPLATEASIDYSSWIESYDEYDLSSYGFVTGTSAHTLLQSANYKNLNHGTSTGIGWSILYVSNFLVPTRTGLQGIDWSKRVTYTFVMGRSVASPSAGCVFRSCLGKTQAGIAVGDLINAGVGIKIQGTGAIELMAHNGTSLVTTTTSFTPSGITNYVVKVVSYGNGTVECFVNGSSVGTNTNAPTTSAGVTYHYNLAFEEQQTAIVATSTQWTINNIKISLGRR